MDAVKFGVQAFYGGDPDRYRLPSRQERSFMGPYFRSSEQEASGNDDASSVTKSFVDSTRSVTRVSAQMADVGTLEMDVLMDELQPRIDSIFPPASFDLTVTGTSIATCAVVTTSSLATPSRPLAQLMALTKRPSASRRAAAPPEAITSSSRACPCAGEASKASTSPLKPWARGGRTRLAKWGCR